MGKFQLRYISDEDLIVVRNIFYSFIVKGISLCISIFSMPLYIQYFNNNSVLGLWYTILSVLTWISMCDLGLGNGLRNKFTEAYSQGNLNLARSYISSTYMVLIVLISIVVSIFLIVSPLFDFNSFFGISNEIIDSKVLYLVLVILFVGISLSFIFKLVNSVIYGIQKSALNNLLSLIISVLPLLYVYFGPTFDIEGNLIALSIVHACAQNIPLIIATIILFSRNELRSCRPSAKFAHFAVAKDMLNLGLKFFLAQVFFMFLMSTNEVFISNLYSPDFVVHYSMYYKIFTILGSIVLLALTPLWSMVTKYLADNNFLKIKKLNKFLYISALIAIFANFMIVPILQNVFNLWLHGDAIAVNFNTAIIFAFYGSSYIANVVLTTVANGIGQLDSQIFFYGVGSLLKVPVCCYLHNCNLGWESIIVYNSIILIAFCVFQLFWVEHKLNSLIN